MIRLTRRRLLAAASATALLGAAPAAADGPTCRGKQHWEALDPGLTWWNGGEGPARAAWIGPVVAAEFREAIPWWEADVPIGAWLEVELRARVGGTWSDWARLGRWGDAAGIGGGRSFAGQPLVDVDTLVLPRPAEAVQARAHLAAAPGGERPRLRGLGLALSGSIDRPGASPPLGLGGDLPVPGRSQMVFPNGGRVWCSPTSVSMVMAYWADRVGEPAWDLPVPEVVRGVWDHGRGIAGNWPFNAAFAAARGLRARVARLASLAETEPWVAAGVPVVASVRFRAGALSGSPILSALGGHLLVVRGFAPGGDVLVNDPAAPSDRSVPRRYDRGELERAWLGGSNGVVYLIHPVEWSVPPLPGACG